MGDSIGRNTEKFEGNLTIIHKGRLESLGQYSVKEPLNGKITSRHISWGYTVVNSKGETLLK